MGLKTPKPPPTTDFKTAAADQGIANVTAAGQTTALSNPNQVGPYGNQTVTYAPDAQGNMQPTVTQTLNPDAQRAVTSQQRTQANLAGMGESLSGQLGGRYSQPFQSSAPAIQTSLSRSPMAMQGGPPPGAMAGSPPPSDGDVNGYPGPMAGSPGPMAGAMGAMAGSPAGGGPKSGSPPPGAMAGGAPAGSQSFAVSPMGAPAGGPAVGGFQGGGAPQGGVGPQSGGGSQGGSQGGPAGDAFGLAGGGPAGDAFGLAGSIDAEKYGKSKQELDLTDVAKMPVNAGMTGQQAIMARLQPQIQQQQAATAQQLANQGITPGSEAYNNAMRTQSQQSNDLYSQAALQGINLDTAANQQGFNQAKDKAGLYNQGLGENFGRGFASQGMTNASIGQNFGQAQDAQKLKNAAIGQNFAQAQSAQGQGFNQNLTAAQFGNDASNQALARELQLRQQPLNEINSLMGSSQIQNPQFQGYTGANVAAAPTLQGAQLQGQQAQDLYGQQMSARNANVAALAQVAATGAKFIPGYGTSDIRLKSNIVRIGDHPLGIGIYEYDIDGHRDVGVMAQEVLTVKPEAVAQRPDGYLMVNYGAL